MQLLLDTTIATKSNPPCPPKGFRAVKGCSWVQTCDAPPFSQTKKKGRGSKRQGILYQDKVVEKLERKYKDWIGVAGLWFEFEDDYGRRYAQADWLGINVDWGKLCLVEVKLSRVPNAWWQLNRLYKPLVQRLFPTWDLALVEVVDKVYNVSVPEDVKVVHDLNEAAPGRTSLMRMGV